MTWLRAEVNLIYICFSSPAKLSSRLPFSSSFKSLPDFPKGCLSTCSQLSWTRYDTSVFPGLLVAMVLDTKENISSTISLCELVSFVLQCSCFVLTKKTKTKTTMLTQAQNNNKKLIKKQGNGKKKKHNSSCFLFYMFPSAANSTIYNIHWCKTLSRCLSKLVFHLNPHKHYILYKIPYNNFC